MSRPATPSSILIVEDHADTADMLRRYLARKGHHAHIAHTGDDALHFLSSHRPDCVILDETMPGMTGLEVLSQIRSGPDGHTLPVFFYSAAFDASKQRRAKALGARGWFVKGVSRLGDLMDSVIATCPH